MNGLPKPRAPRLVISRYWTNPEITVTVRGDGIALDMDLEDFLGALATEMGNPALLVTVNALRTKMQAASVVVCERVKEASKQVV